MSPISPCETSPSKEWVRVSLVLLLLSLVWLLSQPEVVLAAKKQPKQQAEQQMMKNITASPLSRPLASAEGKQLIISLRQRLALDWQQFPEKYHPQDMDLALNGSAWHITRFIAGLQDGNHVDYTSTQLRDEAFDRLTAQLAWRNSFGINEDYPAEVWPCEYWLTGVIQVTQARRKSLVTGRPLLFPLMDFSRMTGYDGYLGAEWLRFIYWNLDRIDQLTDWDTWEMIITLSGASWATMPDSDVVSEIYPMAERFAGKLLHLYTDKTSLEAEGGIGSMIMGSAIDVFVMASPSAARQLVRTVKTKIDMYKLIKKKQLPRHVAGGQLARSESLMSEALPRHWPASRQIGRAHV